MPPSRSKARKKPLVTSAAAQAPPSISRAAAQARISEFHTALKRNRAFAGGKSDAAVKALGRDEAEEDALSTAIDHEALDAYQKLSRAGQGKQRGGDSSKVLVPWLQQCLERSKLPEAPKLRMLEIGAVQHDNYANQSSWIVNTPIDLHSQHPEILQQDFFDRPIPTSSAERFDIMSCSLVLNFVESPERRGEMLRLIHNHLEPQSTSLLFLVLPLPCLENSRYLNRQTLVDLMADIGFELLKERFKESGKVGYWLWGWRRPRVYVKGKWSKKNIVNEGKKRNNFAILLADG